MSKHQRHLFLHFFIFVTLLVTRIFSVIALSSNASDCFSVNLTEGYSYCRIEDNDIDCYVNKAVDFRKSKPYPLPLWVQVCIFELPAHFWSVKDEYHCKIELNSGPVSCTAKVDRELHQDVHDIKENCTFGFFWLTSKPFSPEYYKDLLIDGKCTKHYEKEWEATDTLFVSERYLSGLGVPFTGKSDWIKIKKPYFWNATSIALLVAGIIIICAGIIAITLYVRRKWTKFVDKSLNLENDVTFKQLEAVLQSEELLDNVSNDAKEIPYPFQPNSSQTS